MANAGSMIGRIPNDRRILTRRIPASGIPIGRIPTGSAPLGPKPAVTRSGRA